MIVDWQRHVIVPGDMHPSDVRRERVEKRCGSFSEPSLAHQ
jgi:hypothetical protein